MFDAERRIADLAKLRAQLASIKLTSSSRYDAICSSFFIEPVEWMAPLLVGHKDGKVRLNGIVRPKNLLQLFY